MGKLFVVGTPIGNLGDMSPRGLETLEAVDFIAAEDTRVSLKLLRHYGIQKPLLSYHEHNKQGRGEEIVSRIEAGESCAIITDAGMPCISDPGEDLVALCAQRGVETVVVPGPSAVVSALALSGLATGRFSFEGFLSMNKGERSAHLAEVRTNSHTLIFYEAPHKLLTTLGDLLEALGDRKITLARELTKLHEEVIRTTLSQAVERYSTTPPRGEFVLVIAGASPEQATRPTHEAAVALLLERQKSGTSLSQAAKEVAQLTGYKKADLYKAALDAQEQD